MKIRTVKIKDEKILFFRSDTPKEYTFVTVSSYFRLWRVLDSKYHSDKCSVWKLNSIPCWFIMH